MMLSIRRGSDGVLPKNDFTNKAYLVKVMTKKGGDQKFDDVFYERFQLLVYYRFSDANVNMPLTNIMLKTS